jgi:hypothetical protein
MIHIEGWPTPGFFGCFPVLAANENAVWSGRHLKAGQVRVFDPGQVLRYFAGLTIPQAAAQLGIAPRTADDGLPAYLGV